MLVSALLRALPSLLFLLSALAGLLNLPFALDALTMDEDAPRALFLFDCSTLSEITDLSSGSHHVGLRVRTVALEGRNWVLPFAGLQFGLIPFTLKVVPITTGCSGELARRLALASYLAMLALEALMHLASLGLGIRNGSLPCHAQPGPASAPDD